MTRENAKHAKMKRLALAAGAGLCVGAAAQLPAATFTYSRVTSNTSDAPDLWSAGEGWDAVPVSDAGTTLTFTGNLPSATSAYSLNDIGTFTLNRLDVTYTALGSAPVISISGSSLVFTDNGSTGPLLRVAATGSTPGTPTIATAFSLSSHLRIEAVTDVVIGGPVSGEGGFTKWGAGILALTAESDMTGGITVAAGTLRLNYGGGTVVNNLLPTSSVITFGGTATSGSLALALAGRNSTNNNQTLDGIVLQAGRTSLSTARSGSTGRMNLHLGTITRNEPGAILMFTPGSGTTITTTNLNSSTGIIGPWAMIGQDWAVAGNSGSATQITAYTGYADVPADSSGTGFVYVADNPTANARVSAAATGAGVVALDSEGTVTVNTLMFTDGRQMQIADGQTLRTNAFWYSNTSTTGFTISGSGAITAGSADNTPAELIIRTDQNINTGTSPFISTIEAAIVDNGSGALTLTKAGQGWIRMSGANNYTGKTYVLQGVIELVNGAKLGNDTADVWIADGGQVYLNGGTHNNTFYINGIGPQTQYGSGQTARYGAIRLGSAADNPTILAGNVVVVSDGRITNDGTTYGVITGAITGNGSMSFSTGGARPASIALANPDNDWTGDTILTTSGTTSGIVNLRLDADEVIPNGVGRGSVLLAGSGTSPTPTATLLLNGHTETINALNGVFSQTNENKMRVSNGAATPAVLIIGDADSSGSFRGVIQNGGTGTTSIYKIGAGTQVLTGTSTYTGGTSISAGTLEINNDGGMATVSTTNGRLSGATPITISDGQLLLSGVNTVNDRLNNASTINLAGGKLNLNGLSEGAPDAVGVGVLTLSANSVIDFGAGGGAVVTFAGIDQSVDGAVLTIENWTAESLDGPDRLMFAGLATDFTSLFAPAEINFIGYGLGYTAAQYDGFYEIMPSTDGVPEPAGLSLVALGAAGLLRRRRRS